MDNCSGIVLAVNDCCYYYIMNNKGPNDLDVIIEKLKKENYKLKMEIEMLKKDITFLRQEYRNRALEKRDW